MRFSILIPLLAAVLFVGAMTPGPGSAQGQGAGGEAALKPSGEGAAAQPAASPKREEEPKKPGGIPVVSVETVKTMEIRKTLDLTGAVTATRTARMASPGEGPVLNCTVREGDALKRGERVLSIGRNTAAQAQLAASIAALKEQEQELKRVEQLVGSGAIPGAQLDTARSKFESARAQVAKARESAGDYSVTAPWDGLVSRVSVKDGDYVAPRAVLAEMFDPRSLVVRFAVPEAQSTEVRVGMTATIRFDAHPGKTFRGRVSRIYPELDSRMRTRTAEAVPDEPVDLIPGMFARIAVLLRSVPGAVTVPAEAVVVTPKGEQVAFVVRDGRAVRRRVETGIEDAGRVQIVKGVEAGDEIITAGNEKLKDGAEVQARAGAVR